ncbi:hypothetical protein [Candidatus Nanopelagicus limnes]|nr:hypothetical protein [Candidatus Nanopelagicus limnes]
MNISKLDILKNSRLAMGLALFIIALTAASLISKEANRTVLVWASTGELAPGQIIEQSDLTATSVLLAQTAKNYLSSSAQIVGTTVLNKISAGDLIPVAAIANDVDANNQRLVPLTIEISDLPIALSRGDVIDIYAIAKTNAKESISPTLLVSAVSIEQVLERSNSGVVSVLVILENEQVISTLNYLTDSRLILVRTR